VADNRKPSYSDFPSIITLQNYRSIAVVRRVVHATRKQQREVSMRLFNLFMRRAGIRSVPVRSPKSTSRLTVVCPTDRLADVRRQVYRNFDTAGLRVAHLLVDQAAQQGMARACITIDCPPELRPVLMSQARELSAFPGVHKVQWGDRRHIALN
jgi:hypothetical protein